MKNEMKSYGIGEVLKELRVKRKLTQKQLANKLNISENTIKQYEKNIREPRYEYLLKLCDYFNVSPEFFKKENHYCIQDVNKVVLPYNTNQHKTIYYEKSFTVLKYKYMIDKFESGNNESTHILSVLQLMNKIIDEMNHIVVNDKRKYMCTNYKNHDTILEEMLYITENGHKGKKYKEKPLGKSEAYIYFENKFDLHIKQIEKHLKEIFRQNFEENYVAYRRNFSRKKKEFNLKE